MKTAYVIAAVLALALMTVAVEARVESLFADPKANQIGDALTVIIQETATASNQTSTTTSKNNTTKISSTIPGAGNILDFIPLHTLDSQVGNNYAGNAATSRSARFFSSRERAASADAPCASA